MKNNIKGLAAYAVYILLSFFILYYGVLYVQTFIAEEGFFQAFMRFVVFVVVLILPVGFGALMLDAKQPKEKDFFNGLLVIAVAFILYIIAIITTKGNPVGMIPLGAEGDGWRFFKFFAMPGQVFVYCITLKSQYNALYLLLTCLLPSITFGFGMKANRKYQENILKKNKSASKKVRKNTK